jgi:hypothetical protein
VEGGGVDIHVVTNYRVVHLWAFMTWIATGQERNFLVDIFLSSKVGSSYVVSQLDNERHISPQCHDVLTIVHGGQESNCIWPFAGTSFGC